MYQTVNFVTNSGYLKCSPLVLETNECGTWTDDFSEAMELLIGLKS